MDKYSVLLVDDEELVFEIMMKKLNWEELGFQIVGYARNGQEALEMAEEMMPDIVMTDIKMPYMNGLELSKELKKQYPNIKIIIFSGFDEFEYAKEAIKVEAEEYILKPIDSEELKSVFLRVKESLDKEFDEKRNVDKLRDYYMTSLPVLQDNFLIGLVEGRIPEESIEKRAAEYNLSIKGPYYVATVFHVSHTAPEEEGEDKSFLLSLSVKQLVEERMKNFCNSHVFLYLGEIVAVSGLEKAEDIRVFTDEMDRICKMAKRICNAAVTAGVGYVAEVPIGLKDSYNGAKNAINHRVLYGNTRVINVEEIQVHNYSIDRSLDEHYLHVIKKKMRVGDEESLKDAVGKYCTSLTQGNNTINDYNLRLMKLVVSVVEFLGNYEITMEEITGESNQLAAFLEIDGAEAMEAYLYQMFRKILERVSERRESTTLSFVKKASIYIKENYTDTNLSVDAICAYLGVSSAYFSTAFKKETGKTFITYLTDVRLEKAVELLDTTEDKTYEIAEKTGYSDPNYFSYAFKKKYGVSPSKYRDSKREQS